MKSVLLATNDDKVQSIIQRSLGIGYNLEILSDPKSCLAYFEKQNFDIAFIDVDFLRGSASLMRKTDKAHLEEYWQASPNCQIIILTTKERIREAVNAVKSGANDYLTYPILPEEVKLVIKQSQILSGKLSELQFWRDTFWNDESLEVIQTKSPIMQNAYEKLKSVARTNSTVLLTGGTGVGKGVFAKLIHQHSEQKNGPFVSLHCGVIPETLIESELFGHEKGAFTGAVSKKLGRFEVANGGTIFLDEIATISEAVQIKLLQVLQDRIFQRVGGNLDIRVDVRVIAATNADLKVMAEKGQFRKDLYYRLNVFPIVIPELKDRVEDIPLLAEAILRRFNRVFGKNITNIDKNVMEGLKNYDWPGNIRELENVLERAYILENSNTLQPKNFQREVLVSAEKRLKEPVAPDMELPISKARDQAVQYFENIYLRKLMALHEGDLEKASKTASISTRQLYKLLTKYNIHRKTFINIQPLN